ncbi:glycosyl hydrolase [Dysgonomonas sp. 511]|uniref:glycosyl hydrolase n=1 Tax=Dysgonomonas sp. 511 TaxID=2302930 RepID=UPI0013CF6D38|nr:glycosyl hydrolase [Dysgonomonas sp. 511]NDV79728.1 DNA-binding protein [Dysgonomonas sp. 511]
MKKIFLFFIISFLFVSHNQAQDLRQLWENPPAETKSWTFWYWMHGAVTKEGITADLEAMKQIGLEGAYLMPIRGVPEKPYLTPVVEQLSPRWWEMVDFAFKEADRLGMKIAFHICDGFALAGGPWITPELSMQKVVWSQLNIQGGKQFNDALPRPESYKGYYKDIAVYAFPTPDGEGISTETVKPKVTSSIEGVVPQSIFDKDNKELFRSESPCWIQFEFDKPFTCRTIQLSAPPRSFQPQRLTIEASNDGKSFRKIVQLQPPRQGWQNDDFPMTHSIPATTAKYFRLQYNLEGTEPGAEDLDAAKWKQNLKIKHIWMSSEARIHQYEGKTGQAWRVSPRTTAEQIPNGMCIDTKKMIDISSYLDKDGILNWKAPKGKWTILRLGHTSTGHTNATGGGGIGLECDKFNPEAIRLQFNSWFGKAYELAGAEIASRVLKVFHVDSWECGSQNWSPLFREEFKKRRGYDIYDYLPVMAGFPLESAEKTEKILHDVRQTISELVVDKFYATLKEEANAKGCEFSAENVSPTMMSDGMMHYKYTDIPMNEYWLQSPTHDKPNDVLDAVSGAHVYEKNIIQAEAFTQLRMMFDEHPAMLKTLQDRHYALGINRLSYHVYALNPWLDRQPGMTLDGIGLYFQRDQTWWKLGKAWVDYAQRCHALLQYGKPVVDIAVFTGEELPRRSILPDRLVPFLPGLFGKEKVEWEKNRLENVGAPSHQMPVGVTHSSNITTAEDWVNCLRGYQYDSFNRDALLNRMKVENGRIVLPGGMSYSMLVIPGKHPMQPDYSISKEVTDKLVELSAQDAKILISGLPETPLEAKTKDTQTGWMQSGGFIKLPYTKETFGELDIERDIIITEYGIGGYAKDIAYTHRQSDAADIYFIANQMDKKRNITVSLRVSGRIPELWNPVSGKIVTDNTWRISGGRTIMDITLEPNESCFVVLQTPTTETSSTIRSRRDSDTTLIKENWIVSFDKKMRGPANPVTFSELSDWSKNFNDSIRYYSGTAIYKNTVKLNVANGDKFDIVFDDIANLAEVKVNGKSCGILWTKPYRLDISDAVRDGENKIEIEVVNTWANRILGDEFFDAEPNDSKKIWTNGTHHKRREKTLVKSGLIGNIFVEKSFNRIYK